MVKKWSSKKNLQNAKSGSWKKLYDGMVDVYDYADDSCADLAAGKYALPWTRYAAMGCSEKMFK